MALVLVRFAHNFAVTEDHIRYMTIAVRVAQRNFLVEDPNWAIDFAPNGQYPEQFISSKSDLGPALTVIQENLSSWVIY